MDCWMLLKLKVMPFDFSSIWWIRSFLSAIWYLLYWALNYDSNSLTGTMSFWSKASKFWLLICVKI